MLQDDSLLTAVEAWRARRSALLANEGVTATLRPKSTRRSKNSVGLDLEAAGRLGGPTQLPRTERHFGSSR